MGRRGRSAIAAAAVVEFKRQRPSPEEQGGSTPAPGFRRQVPHVPDVRFASADAEILATVRAGANGRQNAAAHRRALQEKASLFVDFAHFSRLCIGDLREAFDEDRKARVDTAVDVPTRMTKNRRRCWQAAFRYFARHAGIEQGFEIVALDRQGHYTCRLVDKMVKDEWEKLVRLAGSFGIDEEALKACLPDESVRADRGARAMPGPMDAVPWELQSEH